MIAQIKNNPLHLFFFPLLFVANHFFSIATTDAIYSPIQTYGLWTLKVIFSAIVCVMLPWLLYKVLSFRLDLIKSAICSSIIFIPFFFFQDFLILGNFFLENEIRIRWLLLLTLLVSIVLSILVLRSKRSLLLFNEYLNVLSGVLLIYVFLTLIIFFDKKTLSRLAYDPPLRPVHCADCPDIYFFLLDAYTSNKSLREYFQFNNQKFVKNLQNLGFNVSDQAYSSYDKTIYSLGATLNMDPIKNLDKYYEKDVIKIIKDNAIMRSLQQANYEIHNYSLFDIQNIPKYYSNSYEYEMFTNEIFHNTILRFLVDNTGTYLNFFDVHSDILAKVRDHAQSNHSSPRFFYIHILAPHSPFVMNADAEEIGFLKQKNSQKEAYVEQVNGLNKMISETIAVILANSKQSIILIQGDHGSRMVNGADQEKESHTVFLAYLIPGAKKHAAMDQSNKIFSLVFERLKDQ
ncbi:MAG: sulfatase-like hydrolase/transferase [Cyclobacteriaceae bacterium]